MVSKLPQVMEKVKETITWKIRRLDRVRST